MHVENRLAKVQTEPEESTGWGSKVRDVTYTKIIVWHKGMQHTCHWHCPLYLFVCGYVGVKLDNCGQPGNFIQILFNHTQYINHDGL